MEPIYSYSRAEALEDGVLVDVTQQAQKGISPGFRFPVAVTAALWAAIESIPEELAGIADVDGRLYDVLHMAMIACRARREQFELILPVGDRARRKQWLRVDVGAGDHGEPVVTIGFPGDF